jgi:hypothetical protein
MDKGRLITLKDIDELVSSGKVSEEVLLSYLKREIAELEKK